MEERGGRVGRASPNLEAPQRVHQEYGNRQEVRQTPHGHAKALGELRPGDLTALERERGMGLSPPSPPQLVGRGRGLSLTATTFPRPGRTRIGRGLSLSIPTTPSHLWDKVGDFPNPCHPIPLEDGSPLGGARRLLSGIHVTTPFACNPMTFFHPTSLYFP